MLDVVVSCMSVLTLSCSCVYVVVWDIRCINCCVITSGLIYPPPIILSEKLIKTTHLTHSGFPAQVRLTTDNVGLGL